MTARIAIDLNVRVGDGETYAGFEDVEGELPGFADEIVEVYERESGVHGKAAVSRIDAERRLIYLRVRWSSLVDDVVVGAYGRLTQSPSPTFTTATQATTWAAMTTRRSSVAV